MEILWYLLCFWNVLREKCWELGFPWKWRIYNMKSCYFKMHVELCKVVWPKRGYWENWKSYLSEFLCLDWVSSHCRSNNAYGVWARYYPRASIEAATELRTREPRSQLQLQSVRHGLFISLQNIIRTKCKSSKPLGRYILPLGPLVQLQKLLPS